MRVPLESGQRSGRVYPGKPIFLSFDGNENYYTHALILLIRTNCVQIHKSIVGLLPRKHAKSQQLAKQKEVTTRIYNDIDSVCIGTLRWIGA